LAFTEGFLFPRAGAKILEAQALAPRTAVTRREPKRPSRKFGVPFKAIVSDLISVASGQADFPVAGIGMAGRGMQIRAIGRQQLARVPLPARILATAAVGTGVAAGIEVATGRSPAGLIHQAGRSVVGTFGAPKDRRSRPMPRGLAVGQELPPSHQVVRTWQTFPGGPVFARLADGHIAVQKKDGTIKHFRPYRPVVIPRKWNARSMSRVATALKRQRKTATKILRITGGLPTKTVRVGGRPHRSVDVD